MRAKSKEQEEVSNSIGVACVCNVSGCDRSHHKASMNVCNYNISIQIEQWMPVKPLPDKGVSQRFPGERGSSPLPFVHLLAGTKLMASPPPLYGPLVYPIINWRLMAGSWGSENGCWMGPS